MIFQNQEVLRGLVLGSHLKYLHAELSISTQPKVWDTANEEARKRSIDSTLAIIRNLIYGEMHISE